MEVTFEPEALKPKDGQPPAYKGTVTLRMLSYDERLDLYEAYGAETGEAGDDTGEDKKKGMRFMRWVAKRAKDRVAHLSITRLEDGFEFKTFDELNYDSDMASVITEISTRLIGKFQVGKRSTPS